MRDLAQLRHMGLFEARVPRYTSYPTSPHFSKEVGAAEMADWLAQVPAGGSISLYVHVPFCRRLCWFCACRTQGTKTGEPIPAYVESLLLELAMVRARLPEGVTLSRLHWGGGTPTLLPPAQIRRLMGAISGALPFAEGYEFSVEIDPSEIDDPRLEALAEAGMNRASLGVQDFDPVIQKAIGRIQSYEMTRDAAEAVRRHGITSLNMDLLYGLPFQTEATITAGVDKVISLSPDRVALYGYAHVPWVSRRQVMIPTEELPGPEMRLRLAELAAERFLAAGYQAIGIDHFAKPGDGLGRAAAEHRLRRNFQGYTDDLAEVLVGIGASSISRFPQGYVQNATATGAYQQRLGSGRLAGHKGHAFSTDDRLRARIIESLMCEFAADLPALAAAAGVPAGEALALAEGLEDDYPGATRLEDGVLSILPEARVLARLIAYHFDAYAGAATGFSQAI